MFTLILTVCIAHTNYIFSIYSHANIQAEALKSGHKGHIQLEAQI